jgi:hypothetical protein
MNTIGLKKTYASGVGVVESVRRRNSSHRLVYLPYKLVVFGDCRQCRLLITVSEWVKRKIAF